MVMDNIKYYLTIQSHLKNPHEYAICNDGEEKILICIVLMWPSLTDKDCSHPSFCFEESRSSEKKSAVAMIY